MDFCHAVMGCAFASFTTLDTTWKRRIASLPRPNGLARILFTHTARPNVTDIEWQFSAPAQASVFVLSQFNSQKLTGSIAPCRILESSARQHARENDGFSA